MLVFGDRHVWWRDFTDLATGFKHRTVQIYGEDPGSGEDQLVCQFVTPLQAHHVIESPLQAARFVSLLGYVAPRGVGTCFVEGFSLKRRCVDDVLRPTSPTCDFRTTAPHREMAVSPFRPGSAQRISPRPCCAALLAVAGLPSRCFRMRGDSGCFRCWR